MKTRVFCKLKFGSNYYMEDSNICTDTLDKVIKQFNYESKINSQYSFGLKDFHYGLRLIFHSYFDKYNLDTIPISYVGFDNWINERKGYFKFIINEINKKYPNNDFALTYYPDFNVEFTLEDDDIIHEGDNTKDFYEIEFIAELGTGIDADYGSKADKYEILRKIRELYSNYGLRSVFKFSVKVKPNVGEVFFRLQPEKSFEVYNRYIINKINKNLLEKIDKDFNDTIKNLIKTCKIDEDKVKFEKVYKTNIICFIRDASIY